MNRTIWGGLAAACLTVGLGLAGVSGAVADETHNPDAVSSAAVNVPVAEPAPVPTDLPALGDPSPVLPTPDDDTPKPSPAPSVPEPTSEPAPTTDNPKPAPSTANPKTPTSGKTAAPGKTGKTGKKGRHGSAHSAGRVNPQAPTVSGRRGRAVASGRLPHARVARLARLAKTGLPEVSGPLGVAAIGAAGVGCGLVGWARRRARRTR